MEETQELPAFPARPSQSNGLDGDALISSQYKALQEAQFLHEETLRQLRGEIQAQKQRISDIANEQGSAQPPAGLDAIYLRLSELERKIGEDASDPLINEIAHRLAALESSGGRGPDSRVERLSEQIEELRRRASLPHTDPRTDEMALRIASVEGSLRRAQQAFDSESLTGQIQELQVAARQSSEQAAAELADLRQQLTDAQAQTQPDWTGKFDRLEARLAEVSAKSDVEELRARLAQLEQSETDDQSAARLASLTAKVEELAAQLDRAAESSAVTDLRQKIAGLEIQISESPAGPLTDALSARVDQLQQDIEAQSASDAVQALQQRLAALESQSEQTPDAGEAVAELRQRCDALSERFADIEAKLDERRAGEPGVQELREKLSEIEKSGHADSDGRLAELTARLKALELQTEQSESSADEGTLARLSNRLDQLELTGGSSGLTNQVNELRERVAGLANQLREGPAGPAPEAIGRIDERLALLESFGPTALRRIEKLEKREPVPGGDQADAIAELRQRVDQLVNSGASGPGDSATADILREIGMRVQALERNGDSGQGGSGTALREELNERIGLLEARITDEGGIPRFELQSIVERLSYLERSGSPSGEAGGPPPQIMEQLIARYEEIDGRLALMEEGAARFSGGKNSPGSSSVMAEIAELRGQLIELQQNGSGPGVSENFVGKLAEKISSGIAGSEVKAIQMQMYVVYFFLALTGALALSSFFMQ
jgi:chromosome segregation ATPase